MRLFSKSLALSAALATALIGCTDKATEAKIAKLEKENALMQDVLTMMTRGQFAVLLKDSVQAKQLHETVKQQMDMMAQQMQQDSVASTKVYSIAEEGSPAEGPQNAKVTIVEFSDMQCPFCIKSAPMVKEIFEKHKDQVRVIYKHFPLAMHDKAKGAHAASRAAEAQGKFFEFRYELAKQAAIDPEKALNADNYLKIAQSLGLDLSKFKTDMAISADDEARFAQDQKLGTSVGVNGTPTYFVNGKRSNPGTLAADVEQLLK